MTLEEKIRLYKNVYDATRGLIAELKDSEQEPTEFVIYNILLEAIDAVKRDIKE